MFSLENLKVYFLILTQMYTDDSDNNHNNFGSEEEDDFTNIVRNLNFTKFYVCKKLSKQIQSFSTNDAVPKVGEIVNKLLYLFLETDC